MIEVPGWFLIMIAVATFAAAHKRRSKTAFLQDDPLIELTHVGALDATPAAG